MTTNKEPAFPSGLKEIADDELGAINTGMTLRDYFAAQAMQGFCSDAGNSVPIRVMAEDAYAVADAMMEVRKA